LAAAAGVFSLIKNRKNREIYTMGFIEPKRIQIKMLKPDLALALTWWSASFSTSKDKMVGNTTRDLQKFDDVWKIVASHTSTGGT
jgi:hypothetical protein